MFQWLQNERHATFTDGREHLRISFPNPSIARITSTVAPAFSQRPSRIVLPAETQIEPLIQQDTHSFTLSTTELSVTLDKRTGALSYARANGTPLFREPVRGGRWLTPKPFTRNIFKPQKEVAIAQSIDGIRASAASYETVFDRTGYEAKLEFVFAEGEALFGFGSHEEGVGNLRGHARELYQQNMKAVVPAFTSTRGYTALFDCASLMTFHDGELGSYWWADAVDELDFYVITGDSFDAITRSYYALTGAPPMLPRWAFGFLQSKERYVTGDEILDIVQEYRRRSIPLDGIVLDWKSWPNGGGWGQKSFDPHRFPDPSSLTRNLHALGAHLMVSIWPIMTGGCDDQRDLLDHGLMLGNQSTYDAFSAQAREIYWKQARTGLFDHGVDAWWCDCTEPFEADWVGAVKPEPHARLAQNVGESKLYLPATEINAFSLVHAQGIYEGQRAASQDKRVLNPTRSSYAGQHRYGTVTWNGDISATWETLRRCIPEGLHFCATGEPFWTVDIGGFFIANHPDLWFWSGDYNEGCRGLTAMDATSPDPADTGCKDLGFFELYTRWLQYATFLPMFRSHGTDAAREIWRFGEPGSPFYDAIARFIRLRYELMPYIYSIAAAVTLQGTSMLRFLALAFPDDPATHNITDQFLFGPALLVCPVTSPMLYGPGSTPLDNVAQVRSVYLPSGTRWFDLWTNTSYDGGQRIEIPAPLSHIPVFVRSGSILPMTIAAQHTGEQAATPLELRVYTGRDGAFTLYEDAGNGYAYERGEYALIRVTWQDATGELTLHTRHGTFPELVTERQCHIVFIAPDGSDVHTVRYTGQALRITRGGALA
jgi:alpha-D-xyloside xylohydrolase